MNRSMYNALMKKMDESIRQNSSIEEKIDEQRLLLDQSSTQQYLHPIPRPRQGKEMNRSVNVAGYLRKEIETRNASMPSSGRRYLQFPSMVDDDRANRDAIKTLEGLLSYHLPEYFGYNTWEQTYSRKPRICEKLVREASSHQDLKVFSQAAAQWAIRMLLSSKMKTRKRSLRVQENLGGSDEDAIAIANERVETANFGVSAEEVATSAVPDLVVDGLEVTLEERVASHHPAESARETSILGVQNSYNKEFDIDRNIAGTGSRFRNESPNVRGIANAIGTSGSNARESGIRGADPKGSGAKSHNGSERSTRGRDATSDGHPGGSATVHGSSKRRNRANISKRRRIPRSGLSVKRTSKGRNSDL